VRRRLIAFGAALAVAVLAGPALAAEPEIKGLQLGMALPDGEIEAVYENSLAGEVEDSVGLTIPYDHIETKLADGGRLSLHFSSAADGTRLFWIRHATSWRWPTERTAPELPALLTELERRFGMPARSVGPRDGSGDLLLVFPLPGGDGDLPPSLDLAQEDVGGVQFLSYQQRVALFGRGFAGAVVTLVMHQGKLAAAIEELIDHRRGATVLNPGG
jgi:hypothetical protein